MGSWTEKRNTSSVRLMADIAQKQGLTKEACLANTGINDAMLTDPSAEIEASQELQLIENIVDGLGDNPSIALEVGSHYHLTTYGIWGFAFTSSRTLRDAVEIGLRYISLTFAFCKISLNEEGEYAYLYVDSDGVPEKLRPFVLNRDTAAIMNIHRELFTDPMPVEEFYLQSDAPQDISIYKTVFNIEPKFGQARNYAVFQRSLLDLPLPTANETTMQLLVAQCQNLLEQRQSRTGVANKVRQRLIASIDKAVNMEAISEALCVSPRTLRRQLTAENTSFRNLQEEVRETLACEFIQTTNLTMEEIAVRLGYSDTSNFFHAFKRWKGMTPNEFRQQ